MPTYKYNSANYYFEYKIELISNDLPNYKVTKENMPRLYIERNYKNDNLNYFLYAIIPDWLEPKEEDEKKEKHFDYIVWNYDVAGVDCASIKNRANKNSKDEIDKVEQPERVVFFVKNEEVVKKFKEDHVKEGYKADLYRMILLEGLEDFSGAGTMEFHVNDDPSKVVVYHFVINFLYKKRITYRMQFKDNSLLIKLHGNNILDNIKIKVLRNKDRLPCLTEDDSDYEEFVSFDNNGNGQIKVEFNEEIIKEYKTHNYRLAFGVLNNEEIEKFQLTKEEVNRTNNLDKYYFLDCVEDKTVKTKKAITHLNMVYQCPYCHDSIEIKSAASAKAYMSGGVSCKGNVINIEGENTKIYDKDNRPLKNCIYCDKEIKIENEGKYVKDKIPERILPLDWLEKKNFKVAILGAARAGKSTYLSRLFGVEATGHNDSKKVKINPVMLSNALKKLNNNRGFFKAPLSVSNCNIPLVVSQNNKTKVSTSFWQSSTNAKDYYSNYAIGFGDDRHYPEMTDKDIDTNKYPFILDVNKKSYVYFYDVPGENAEDADDASSATNVIEHISKGKTMGIFCIINANPDKKSQNAAVIDTIKNNFMNENYPVAIILSQFDRLEERKVFDNNCYCLRDDYLDIPFKKYAGSYLEKVIDKSSEEIEAYLIKRNMYPKIKKTEGVDNSGFSNVKFFNVSSFSNAALEHGDGKTTASEKNALKYESSPKRIELPLIWMLNQFEILS